MTSIIRRRALPGLLTLVLLLAGVGVARTQTQELSPEELRRWQDEGRDFLLIDARPSNEYALRKIGNALNIPAFVIQSRKLPRARAFVVYDDGVGTRDARRAADELTRAGHRDVQVLQGGLASWEARGYPVVARPGLQPIPLVQPISANQLAQAMADGAPILLVDLRTLEEYASGRLAGATHAPPIFLEASLAGLPRDRILILYDNGDGEGARHAERLRRAGYRVVRYLFGGIPGWLERNLPLQR